MPTSSNFMLVVFALTCGVLAGVYLGVLAFFVACEVFGMCRAYEGPPHPSLW